MFLEDTEEKRTFGSPGEKVFTLYSFWLGADEVPNRRPLTVSHAMGDVARTAGGLVSPNPS